MKWSRLRGLHTLLQMCVQPFPRIPSWEQKFYRCSADVMPGSHALMWGGMLQGPAGWRLCPAMPGRQRFQAVHRLLLGCGGAAQAAWLGLHPRGSPGEHSHTGFQLAAAVRRMSPMKGMCHVSFRVFTT